MASKQARQRVLAPAPSAASVTDLPEAVIASILQHVPLHQRMASCVLVCRAWAAAAAVAPVTINSSVKSREQCKQLQDWLQQHGAAVVRLSTKSSSPQSAVDNWQQWRPLHLAVTQLKQLRSLDLSSLKLQLAAVQGVSTRSRSRRLGSSGACHNSSSIASAVLPQLQTMKLSDCRMTLGLLSQLLSSSSLSKLDWKDVEVYTDSWKKPAGLSTLWQRLQLLPNLSELRLQDGSLTAADISPLSNLQRLQDLTMRLHRSTKLDGVLAVVPAGVSYLLVDSVWSPAIVAADSHARVCAPELCTLKTLRVWKVHLTSSTLINLSGLQDLNLSYVSYAGSDEQGVRQLLAALEHLTQLRCLSLLGCKLHTVQAHAGQADGYRCFSALTASTQLTGIFLTEMVEVPIPQAGLEHAFPPGKLLPRLFALSLCSLTSGDGHCVEAAQVARIAATCPGLYMLTLHGVTPTDFDVSCLLQLPPRVSSVIGLDWSRPTA